MEKAKRTELGYHRTITLTFMIVHLATTALWSHLFPLPHSPRPLQVKMLASGNVLVELNDGTRVENR